MSTAPGQAGPPFHPRCPSLVLPPSCVKATTLLPWSMLAALVSLVASSTMLTHSGWVRGPQGEGPGRACVLKAYVLGRRSQALGWGSTSPQVDMRAPPLPGTASGQGEEGKDRAC